MKRLTIGAATFDDFEGVFFTFQALRLANLERLDELDFVLIDNNPESNEGVATREFCEKAGVRYFPERAWRSTATRDLIFRHALASWAMSLDPHVLLEPKTVSRLLDFLETQDPARPNLFQGPMLYDYLGDETPATHMNPVWRENMFGTWGHDERGKNPDGDPFKIPAMGLGLFVCGVESWPGFNPLFRGFGGEEGYIHQKARNAGGKTLCLPFLRWVHRFQRPRGISYPLNIQERIRNYALGWSELGLDLGEVVAHFRETHPHAPAEQICEDARKLWQRFQASETPDAFIDETRKPDENVEATPAPLPFEMNKKGVETWHDTTVDFGGPVEVQVYGRTLRLARLNATWALL